MKKINAIAWLFTMLMTLVTSPAFATDWGSENVTMQVGETKTLYLPSSVTTKTLKSVTFYSASWNDVEVLSHTNYSVKVKALKATSSIKISLANLSASCSSSASVPNGLLIWPIIICATSWKRLNQNLSASFPLTVRPITIFLSSWNVAPCKKEPSI